MTQAKHYRYKSLGHLCVLQRQTSFTTVRKFTTIYQRQYNIAGAFQHQHFLDTTIRSHLKKTTIKESQLKTHRSNKKTSKPWLKALAGQNEHGHAVKTKGSCRTSTCLWWKNINLTKNNIHITTTETCWSKPRFSLKENMHEDWRNHQRGFTKFNIHTNYTKAHNSNCSRWYRSGCTYAPAPEE